MLKCYCCKIPIEQTVVCYRVSVSFSAGTKGGEAPIPWGDERCHMRTLQQVVCSKTCLAMLFDSIASNLVC